MRSPPRALAFALALVPACGPEPTATTTDGTSSSTVTSSSTATSSSTLTSSSSTVTSSSTATASTGGLPTTTGTTGAPECAPGEKRCAGDEVQECDANAEWGTLEVCSGAQGLTCDEATKTCTGACLPGELGLTATGCEFYAVPMTNTSSDDGSFVVIIENPGPTDATITVTQNDGFEGLIRTAPAGKYTPITLPWIFDLLASEDGELIPGGAYRLQSDRPVRAIQYATVNPSISSDSSLLWPRHTWGTSYFAGTREASALDPLYYPGAWAIVGGDDGTMVAVTPRPGTTSTGGHGIGLDGGGALPMHRGDVLQIVSDETGDLCGAHITADRPVQVFGAHPCAFLPADVLFCDHLEDAMLPTAQLGTLHLPVPPVHSNPDLGRRDQVVRVIATDGPTELTYDPPQPGFPATISGTGEFVELAPSPELYALTTSKPVVVLQFMLGSQWDGQAGHPSMLVTLPTARFHPIHYVHTLTLWLPMDIDITAPAGATVTIDGAPVGGWVEVGGSGFQVAHVRFPADLGLVEIAGDEPIAVSVYATKESSSFWYGTGGAFAP